MLFQGQTALHCAVKEAQGNVEIVKALLAHHADPNAQDHKVSILCGYACQPHISEEYVFLAVLKDTSIDATVCAPHALTAWSTKHTQSH